MYSYNAKTQTLKIFQKDLGDPQPIDLLTPIRESYAKYKDERVFEDIEFLAEEIRNTLSAKVDISNVKVVMSNEDVALDTIPDERKSYCVVADVVTEAVSYKGVVLFRFPYMDQNCCVGGKFVVHELLKLEELSYDRTKDVLTLVLPNRVIPFEQRSNEQIMWAGYGKARLHVYYLAVAALIEFGYCKEQDVKTVLMELFKSPQMRRYANQFKNKLPITSIDVADKFAGTDGTIRARLMSTPYKLGRTRQAMNAHLSLDRALGQTLAEPLAIPKTPIVIPKGTLIDASMLAQFKKYRVTRVIVEHLPELSGKKLSEAVHIRCLKRGTEVTEFLREFYPDLVNYHHVPVDYPCNITFPAGTIIDYQLLSIIRSSGVEEIHTSDGNIPYLFKHEIITNNCIRVEDLYASKKIPEGCIYKRSDFLYIPTVEQFESDLDRALCTESLRDLFVPQFLNIHDIISLIAFNFGVRNLPDVFDTYDRDEDFVKRVRTMNETLSDAFRGQVRRFLLKNQVQLRNFLLGKSADARTVFRKLTDAVRKDLMDRSIYRSAEKINPLAMLSGVRQVGSMTGNAAVSQRSIVMGHVGRLDPYETPAGKKIGLNTTLPTNARIRDGQLECAYHPIEKIGGKSYVSRSIVWLSQLEEFGYRLGDIMSIQTETSNIFTSPIVQTNVIARVPASKTSDEKITVDTIPSTQLDYVSVFDSQTLGVTAQLIPFLGANDGVRVSYAISMMKQAVNLLNSEVPRVITSMYYRMFEETDTYVVRAKSDGVVKDITSDRIYTTNDESIPVREISVASSSFITLDFRVSPGDSFSKGDILADSSMSRDGMFTPGRNLFVAYCPLYGYNNEDALPITEKAAALFTSVEVNMVEKELRVDKDERLFVSKEANGYVSEGATVFSISRASNLSRTNKEALHVNAPMGKSGICYKVDSEVSVDGMTRNYEASLIDFAPLHEGDKIVGRHGNKSTVPLVFKSSEFPMFLNGVTLDVCQNPCGIPSRMNPGQQLEGILGFVAWMFDIRVESDSFNGATTRDINELWNFMLDCIESDNLQAVFSKYSHLPRELFAQAEASKEKMAQWRGCLLPGGKAWLMNQKTGKLFENPISVGMGYYMKLNHEVTHKMHVRGGIVGVDYSQLENQPPKGSSRGGGQRIGEMEFDALGAHGVTENIRECSNEKSDNIQLRDRLAPIMVDDQAIVSAIDYNMQNTAPRGTEYIKYLFEAMGLDMTYSDGYPLDLDSVLARVPLRNRKMPAKLVEDVPLDPEVMAELERFTGALQSVGKEG